MTAAAQPPLRVGVYIDGYNLYYGGRGICGRGVAGWRWLDLRQLATTVIGAQSTWQGAVCQLPPAIGPKIRRPVGW